MANTIYATSWTGSAATGKVTQRAYMTYTVTTNSATTYTVTVNGSGIQQWNGTWSKIKVTCGLTNQSNVSKTLTKSSGSNYLHEFYNTKVYTYTKTHSTQPISITGTATITGGVDSSHGSATVLNKPSTVTLSLTIPAKDNYAVTYDANGGTGAPASQTKWYGENLTLQSDVPTRNGYLFLGWGTSASATTASYQPSATYTANAALALYAVWEKNAIMHKKISGAWKEGTPTTKAAGTWHEAEALYVKVNGAWREST